MRTFSKNKDWYEEVRRLPDLLAQIDREGVQGGMREALVAIWVLVASAPSALRQNFNGLAEAEIQAVPEGLDERSFGLALPPVDDAAQVMLALARAMFFNDYRLDRHELGTVDPLEEWLITWQDEEYYVVPKARAQWTGENLTSGETGAFGRRALRCRRIVPRHHDGAEVRFHLAGNLPTPMTSYGAVVFDGMEMKLDKSQEGNFLVDQVSGVSLQETALSGIRTAREQGLAIVVYPELMIDPPVLDAIQKELVDKTGLNPIGLVLAGSWHVREGANHHNEAVLFDGYGNELLKYRKRLPFLSKDHRVERIEPGAFYEVLVTDQGLISFATCLDFAQRYDDSPYGALDLELVMVPSCGNTTTMGGHLLTAQDLFIRRKTRSFVVQQADEMTAQMHSVCGFVLFPDQDPTQIRRWEETTTKACWSQSSGILSLIPKEV